MQTKTIDVEGMKYTFNAISGTVLGTDQRSDTHVQGRGSAYVYKGTGGGSSQVSSHVEISRDIWIKQGNGQEKHYRLDQDVPVREGHILHFVELTGPYLYDGDRTFYKHDESVLFSLYNESTGERHRLWASRDDFINKGSVLHKNLPPLLWGGILFLWIYIIGILLTYLIWKGCKNDEKIQNQINAAYDSFFEQLKYNPTSAIAA